MNPTVDIYFTPEYGKLYEQIEGGICESFDHSSIDGAVRNVYIKRPVPWPINGIQYFDIITPYGYGGPIILEAGARENLIETYWREWTIHCRKERIVCEFVRFHPLVANQTDFGSYYDTELNRHTLAIDLTDKHFMINQFTSKCRNMIRKAEKIGVVCELDEACEEIERFCEMYHRTMKKDNANEFYFFPLEYFKAAREKLYGRLMLINARQNGQIIAASLFMLSKDFMHYHLSATDPNYYHCAANNLILKTAAIYGNETERRWLHLGGGLTSRDDDVLFKFKRSFAKEEMNQKAYYLGRIIYDRKAYEKLIQIRREHGVLNDDCLYFPKYRQ